MTPVVFHVDIDAFFASVEQLDHPEYAGRPVVVGAAPGGRGVVSTCSYEARRYGIHSAMPISQAYARCPKAIFLPVRMGRYKELSDRVMGIFGDFTPELRQLSVDEAFLDMTGTGRLFGPPKIAAAALKDAVRAGTGLSVSVGIARNRYVAKMASALSKPDGLLEVAPGDEASFVAALPLDRLWGVGEKTRQRLLELGLNSVKGIAALSPEALKTMLGEGSGGFLYRAVRGMDPGIFSDQPKSRSMSTERTFQQDVTDRDCLEALVLSMAHELAERLMAEGLESRVVQIKLRYADFTTLGGRETLSRKVACADDIREAALELLDRKRDPDRPVRLLGVGLANLEPPGKGEQGELFGDRDIRKSKVERAVLDLKVERGLELVKARLLSPGRPGGGAARDPSGEAPARR